MMKRQEIKGRFTLGPPILKIDVGISVFGWLYLKLVSAIFYQIFIFSPNDKPLKTMKNAFYFN